MGNKLTASALTLLLATLAAPAAVAQDREGDDRIALESITVTGSRIKRVQTEEGTPVVTLTADDLAASGINSIGDILQRLSVSSSSLNTKFNSAGNFGFPADGGGVGSGSTTVSLRNLGAKRVLVLVDGLRWVNESSASGVSAAVDLNTIPFGAVERVEILTDGASALYGSDAVAGVVNIVTKKDQDHIGIHLYGADYSTGDGATQTVNLSFGGSGAAHSYFVDIGHYNQEAISSAAYKNAAVPIPGTGVTFGSSATPTTRSVFFNEPGTDEEGGLCPLADTDGDGVGDRALCNITANGTAAGPGFVQDFPDGFHQWSDADRFNFSPFNLMLTPSERTSLFGQAVFDFGAGVSLFLRGVVNTRESANQAAPEPIFIGAGAGTGGLADTVEVHESNPFNPFGFTLDADHLVFAGRRPIEGSPRIFNQNVDTLYLSAGLSGDFEAFGEPLFWDLNVISARNEATQTVRGTYNIFNISQALGPVADCTDPCVPLNFFGGPGTITPEMLNWIEFNEVDTSKQELTAYTANLSGNLFALPSGPLAFAAGIEYRDLSGSYRPDEVVIRGHSNGVPSLPTDGSYDVSEAYLELSVPVLSGLPAVEELTLSLASRFSDYSTFGDTTNSKIGLHWALSPQLVVRGTWAEGFRAPSIGELFGAPARFDATIEDPCSGATDPDIIANCQAQGTPPGFMQANPQIGVRTGGNIALTPETAESLTWGIEYSPAWAEGTSWSSHLDIELTYYDHDIDDAIQPIDPQTQLDRCVETNSPAFCSGISRGPSGDINSFDNTLLNLGNVTTSGYDLEITWVGQEFAFGRFGIDWQATLVEDYKAVNKATGLPEPRRVGIEVNDSAIPEWRSTLRLNWSLGDLGASLATRYISAVTEECGNVSSFPVCGNQAAGTNELPETFYHDLRVQYTLPTKLKASISMGVNNILDEDPPVCVSCSLNGYDASLYDLPGTFAYVEADIKL